ncbi:hypothetical protein R3W88_025023 [Solanum pinnatisectum]|uniref:Uncharacterized protein n=1 Tax=Solanum pinnatisectum TaxID=50273 RepID=A0AAV9M569_9SOLN|nr:hypothetical protein R3W88_025023 [Solanum pinnatisectum]
MKDHSSRLLHWIVMGITLLVLGIIPLHRCYSFKYAIIHLQLLYSAFFILVDILNQKYPQKWIGKNAMLVYVGTLLYVIFADILHILEALVLMKFASFACLLYKIRCSIVLETRKSFI